MHRIPPSAMRAMLIGLLSLVGMLVTPGVVLAQQTPRVGPLVTQTFGVGATGLVAEASSDVAGAAFFNSALGRVYLGVALNVFSTDGEVSVANDFQIGYAFVHRNDPAIKDRVAMALTAGYWMPQEGDGSLMAALNGFTGPSRWPVTLHTMFGFVFPKVGDPVYVFRVGVAWVR